MYYGSVSDYYPGVDDAPIRRYGHSRVEGVPIRRYRRPGLDEVSIRHPPPDPVYVEDRYIHRRIPVPTVETLREIEAAEDWAWRAEREDTNAEYLSALYRARKADEEEERKESVWKQYDRLPHNREKWRPTFPIVDTRMMIGRRESGSEDTYVEQLLAAYRAGRRDEAEERVVLVASSPSPTFSRERTPYINEHRYRQDRKRETYYPERRYSDDVRHSRYGDGGRYL